MAIDTKTSGKRKRSVRSGRRPIQATFISALLFVAGVHLLSLALPLAAKGDRAWWHLKERFDRHEAYELLWDALKMFDFGGNLDTRKTTGMVVLIVISVVLLTASIALFLRRRFGQRLAIAVIAVAIACEAYAAADALPHWDLPDLTAYLAQTLLLLCALLITVGPRVSAWLQHKLDVEPTFD